MATKPELSIDDKQDDSEEFYSYPAHKMVGVLQDLEKTEAAIKALKADGFTDEDIDVFGGQKGLERLDFAGEKHGWWGHLVRALQHFGEESRFIERYEKELTAGHFLLMVKAADDEKKEQARVILLAAGGHRLTYFGYFLIEVLLDTPPTEPKTMTYGFRRKLDAAFSEAVERARAALTAEGFGVLSEIDLKEKFQEKLGADFRNYVILGACNPSLAFEALREDLDLGLLLPCNVVVYEEDSGAVVAAIDAVKMMSVVGNSQLDKTARTINEKLRRVIDSL